MSKLATLHFDSVASQNSSETGLALTYTKDKCMKNRAVDFGNYLIWCEERSLCFWLFGPPLGAYRQAPTYAVHRIGSLESF